MGASMGETMTGTDTDAAAETRLKRLRMRSWRRGIKEMDLILGGFADTDLAELGAGDLALYEALLSENDHDLYAWVTARIGTQADAAVGAAALGPVAYGALLDRIAAHAAARLR